MNDPGRSGTDGTSAAKGPGAGDRSGPGEGGRLLTRGIAHDINNLMFGILGNLDLLLREIEPDRRLRERAARIEALAQRASELSRYLLALGRRPDQSPQVIELSKLVAEAVAMSRCSLASKVVIETEMAADPLPVEGETIELRQLFANLIGNAVEAVGPGPGRIRVSTKTVLVRNPKETTGLVHWGMRSGMHACVEIADDGCGMDEATRQRVFEPFFSTKATDRGMGLPLARLVLQRHAGALTIDSAPGRGTRFRVLLPNAAG
jgi:signal transduction histidine kinase